MSGQPHEPVVALYKLVQALDMVLATNKGITTANGQPQNISWRDYVWRADKHSKEGYRMYRAWVEAHRSLEEFGVKP